MKTCFKCGIEKPRDEYYKHQKMADGLLGKCKQCTKSDVSLHRLENIESIREYDNARAKLPHRKEQRKKIYSLWAIAHPKRKSAQSKLRHALTSGKVQKQPCMVCGKEAEAHHPDYDRPLDVVWLCRPHHCQAHALVKII